MKIIQKYYLFILFATAINVLGIVLYHHFFAPKLAVVRSALVIERYRGFDDVNKFLTQKKQGIQTELDSLQKAKNTKEQTALLYQKAANYESSFKEESEKLTQTVLEKINKFTAEYAKRKGYDIVLGTTLSGNVLHAEPNYDITEDLIIELNKAYDKGQ